MGDNLTIGKLAKIAGVNVETIRYYQRRGLLLEPPKSTNGQRHYPASCATHLQFIKRAQQLGFSLSEITQLLQLEQAGDCRETHALATHKLSLIRQKIADLQTMQQALETLIEACEKRPDATIGCPILLKLTG
ncbi:MerR family transcriptional regulator [Thiothrix winogradskyi]|uniref:Mercuric resistance operon regulatory protein n=1 Tax=Thiothrix winogradskyi TaxID=96472 RepID=A0ABY3T770_9GAMM|nr:MerR family transcriptional regulator [Thiothrix winogradskyi]UJS26370.1 MerR family transcriptional regulator [Thiothrix winogradskyi]